MAILVSSSDPSGMPREPQLFEVPLALPGRLFMSPAPVCQERWLDGVEALAGNTSSSAPWPPVIVCNLLQDAERARLGLANFAAQVRTRPRIQAAQDRLCRIHPGFQR